MKIFKKWFPKRFHWYCMTFYSRGNYASYTAGYARKYVNLAMTVDAKKKCNMQDDAVVMSIAYLGHLSTEEYKDGTLTNE